MNKISIAIIDDESLVRLGIKSSVEWENYGYEKPTMAKTVWK